jgi:hypothetical protein
MAEVIDSSQATNYQIRIKGQLGSQWRDWFGGLMVTLEENGDTLLTGLVIDQSALHGLLRKVRDLGMSLVSVNPVEAVPADAENARQEMNDQIRSNSEETYESTSWDSD